MSVSRATSGVALHIDLSGSRLRAGLEHELREAVRRGRLAPGIRLPSSRTFARELGIARNTVADAYGQLIAEGWLVARQGGGTWVAGWPTPCATTDAMPPVVADRVRFDLRPGVPELGAFPRAAWIAATRRAFAVADDSALGYSDPRGLSMLREALAGYLARARRVTVDPERVLVCSGFGHGLDLICAMLRRRGATTVAVEAYGRRLHRDIIEANGLATTTLPVDSGGASFDDVRDVGAALLTPAHQFPTGVALDPVRRRSTVAWAAGSDSLIIEDDYDGEFRYDRQPVGAMQSLAPDQVVYAGTASKSLAPGLRLAWLVVPDHLLEELVEVQRIRGGPPSSVDQLTLAEFIGSGAFDRHVRGARLAYRRRRDRLVASLAGSAPTVEISGISAGLHALVHLQAGDEHDVVARAADQGLAVQGLGEFTAPGHERGPALVIGYATPPDHAYTAALARLTTVLASSEGVSVRPR
jgi:GntR family transcriptional regulator/MocR family aminotransferase